MVLTSWWGEYENTGINHGGERRQYLTGSFPAKEGDVAEERENPDDAAEAADGGASSFHVNSETGTCRSTGKDVEQDVAFTWQTTGKCNLSLEVNPNKYKHQNFNGRRGYPRSIIRDGLGNFQVQIHTADCVFKVNG